MMSGGTSLIIKAFLKRLLLKMIDSLIKKKL